MEFDKNPRELYDFTEDLLNADQPVRLKVTGNSMFPLLQSGDVVVVEKCSPADLKPGNVVGVKIGSTWVAHRLLKITARHGNITLLTKGDTCKFRDPELPVEKYIGKVICFSRNGREKSLESRCYRNAGTMIARFSKVLTIFFVLFLKMATTMDKATGRTRSIAKSLLFSTRGSRKLVMINGVISIFQGMLPFLMIYLLKILIDAVSAINPITGDATSHRMLPVMIIATGLVFLSSAVLTILGTMFRERLSQSITRYIYGLLHHKHSSLEMVYLEDASEQDKIHRAVQEAGFRPLKMVNEGLALLQSAVSFLFMAALLINLHWLVFLLLVVALLPGFMVRIRFSAALYKQKKENSRKERESYYYNRILTSLAFAKELRLFGLGKYFMSRFDHIQTDLYDQKNALVRSRVMSEIAAHAFAVGLIFCTFGYVTFQAVEGLLSVGTVVLFFLVFQRGFSVLKDLFQSMAGLSEDSIFLNDFFEFMHLPVVHPVSNPAGKLKPLTNEIRVEGVSFQYPSSLRMALNSVSLTIPACKTVAIVGANGSGKTTLVKLLCGFYAPASGKILYDAEDISTLNPGEIRNQVTAVFQDFALYNISAAENIGLGDVSAPLNMQDVRKAAQQAGIGEVLEKLALGYHNPLGNLFEKGEELSIGQWQKIAIARAFYRNSPILFLDEPSSALDAEAELCLLQHLKSLAENKTVVIISHRFSTIQWADIIYVMHEGELVESGNHADLMKASGRYAAMYSLNKNS